MPRSPSRHSLVWLVFCALAVLLLLLALAARPLAAVAQQIQVPSVSSGTAGGGPVAHPRPPQGAASRETAPAAVVLSNGQRWERITLRHIDVRTLAPLFGATLLPTEDQWFLARWSGGAAMGAGWTGPGASLAAPSGAGFLEGPPQPVAGPGFSGPGRLPILADPVTNSLIVDP
jgi:hypothetical protein